MKFPVNLVSYVKNSLQIIGIFVLYKIVFIDENNLWKLIIFIKLSSNKKIKIYFTLDKLFELYKTVHNYANNQHSIKWILDQKKKRINFLILNDDICIKDIFQV